MHNFETQPSTIKNISPCINYMTLIINNRLVEVETIQIEGHRGYTKSGEPDAYNRPGSKEEMK